MVSGGQYCQSLLSPLPIAKAHEVLEGFCTECRVIRSLQMFRDIIYRLWPRYVLMEVFQL
jgi:hypothetical protein